MTGSSRALRQLRAMEDLGLRVTVVQTDTPRQADALPGVAFRVLGRPRGRGPGWFWAAHRDVRRAALSTPAALYVASDLYTLPALAAAARRHRARLVYDSRELYAALDSAAGRPLVGRVWEAVERRHIGRADAVLTVGDQIAGRLAEAYGIDRPLVLYNAPDSRPDDVPDRGALRRVLGLPDDGRVVVLYQGLFRPGRGLPALVDAAGRVEDVRLVLIGEGALDDDLRQRGAGLGDRLVVHPFVPPDVLRTLTPGADVGACLIEPLTESLRLSLPNKLFEYLAAGLPVVASPLPEVRAVFDRAPAGLLADPSDPAAVADALRLLLDPAARARLAGSSPAALAPYTRTEGRAAFRHLISRLLPA